MCALLYSANWSKTTVLIMGTVNTEKSEAKQLTIYKCH